MKNSPDRDQRPEWNADEYGSDYDFVLFQNLKQIRDYAKQGLDGKRPLNLRDIRDKDRRIRDVFEAGRKLNMSDRLLTLLVLSQEVK